MNPVFIIIASLFLSAFFSGMEIAFIASNKLRIELDRKQGRFSSRIIALFMNNPAQYITTMLIGNNIALVVYGIVMAKILQPLITQYITSSETAILLIQTIISTFIILITAEFLPKTVFRVIPNLLLNLLSLPVFIFYLVFYPIGKFTIWISNSFLKKFTKGKSINNPYHKVFGKVDLANLVFESQDERSEDEETKTEIKLFQNALDFSNVKLRDCLVPRTEIIALEINSTIDDLKKAFVETGYSKILIYKDTIDNIVGYISSKELFKNPQDIESRMNKISIVPETMPANKLLKMFMQEHKSVAIVVDEFGGTAGMVTTEDIMEEIFGEIEDEHDVVELIEKEIKPNEFVFSGRLEVDYLNEKHQIAIPESDDYDTLAGFILFHNQSIPKPNETIEISPFQIKILKSTNTKIELVKLTID